MTMEEKGLQVLYLGIDVPLEKFVTADLYTLEADSVANKSVKACKVL